MQRLQNRDSWAVINGLPLPAAEPDDETRG
jgi:hypothetical protein